MVKWHIEMPKPPPEDMYGRDGSDRPEFQQACVRIPTTEENVARLTGHRIVGISARRNDRRK